MIATTKRYSNEELTIIWKPNLCTHATTCFVRLGKVFDPTSRPWVDPDGASTQEIIKVVDACPSKALTWVWNKDLEKEEQKKPVEIAKLTVLDNGPILVTGSFKLTDSKGNVIECQKSIALCRCGASANQPYCDGSHTKAGFKNVMMENTPENL